MSGARHPGEPSRAGQPVLTLLLRLSALAFFHLPTRLPLPVRLQRLWIEAIARTAPIPRATRVTRIELDGVSAERLEAGEAAGGAPGGCVLYLHGGAYLVGSARVHRTIAARLARASGAPVHVTDYRLAPEHPFPAAFEDARAAYRALLAKEEGPVLLAGDSAGGGLALAVALACRDEKLPRPAGLFLICPWVDLATDRSRGPDRDPILPRALLERGARLYLDGHDPRDPRCSPLFAELSALPPMLVHAAAEDPLRDDSDRLAERAVAAGSEVELRRFGLWHDFHSHAGILRAADAALQEAGAFARTSLARDAAAAATPVG